MKHTQTVGKGGVKSSLGFLVILCVVTAVYALNALITFLTRMGLPYLAGSLLFWGLGAGLAVFLFYRFAIVYEYEIGDAKMVISRVYIRNPRLMLEIFTREIAFLGTPEEAHRRYPSADTKRALTRRAPDPAMALVYVRNKEAHILLIEPNEEIKNAILAFVKKPTKETEPSR